MGHSPGTSLCVVFAQITDVLGDVVHTAYLLNLADTSSSLIRTLRKVDDSPSLPNPCRGLNITKCAVIGVVAQSVAEGLPGSTAPSNFLFCFS